MADRDRVVAFGSLPGRSRPGALVWEARGQTRKLPQHWGASPGGEGPDAPGCKAIGPTGPYENLEHAADLKPGYVKKGAGEASKREKQHGHGCRL